DEMTPRALLALHERLCRARAYPASAEELAATRRLLAGFSARRDLRRSAERLADSGIAGTPIRYRFYWPMARWLARRYPALLGIDWSDPEFEPRLAAALDLLAGRGEAEAIRRLRPTARRAIERLRDRSETDAAFVIRRLEALPGGDRIREAIHDAIDVAYRLEGSPSGPSRTLAEHRGAPIVFGPPPARSRPRLRAEIARAPQAVRALDRAEGTRLVDLAREAMVTRARDLDAFAHGDPRDVRLVDDGGGLAFALIGVVPSRRLFLPAVYGALTLRNGVPIGYVQLDVLLGNAELSFNMFETFRGGEAGSVFARLLAAAHHVFGVRSFSIEPYQLGRGNDEGIDSGAWWFYARFGFRPRGGPVARLARSELARRARDPRHRSSRATLLRLAEAHLHWAIDPRRPGIVTPIESIGLAAASSSRRGPSAREAMRRLGVPSVRGWSADERLWLERWAPLIEAVPGIERWSPSARRGLVRIVRAKGGRRESAYARLFDAHGQWVEAVLALGIR
ncbi:MAG TPA: hypothetical protein VFB67_12620, partial [Candidatus Polarisedimenticolaceae bacterium]|nr:hypothetical protein [Candidatus Polarisedimenticolaceae bacterium]